MLLQANKKPLKLGRLRASELRLPRYTSGTVPWKGTNVFGIGMLFNVSSGAERADVAITDGQDITDHGTR